MPRFLFGATIFVSAFLLFLVQPMVGRLLLPVLGGAATVWTACLLFFQAALLGGYALAHLTSRLPTGVGLILQLCVLAIGAFSLPLAVGGLMELPEWDNPTLWLLKTLTLAIGLPFLALSSNAPVLQRWFRFTNDRDRDDPYFLYSASNVGSLLGLLVYPLVFEPLLTLTTQRYLWSFGYAALFLLVASCALVVRAKRAATIGSQAAAAAVDSQHAGAVPISARQLGGITRWVGLAFVPSSLSVGVTAYVSTELAPIPLLWVLPLSLYLLTFIQAFAGRPFRASDRRVRLAAMAAFPLAVWHVSQTAPSSVLVVLHLAAFYVIARLCHSRLYAERPPASRLTGFYLWVAAGGALGGVFNALVAPLLFDTAAEYPLVLILSAAWLGVSGTHAVSRLADVTLPRIVAGLALLWVAVTNVPIPSVALWVPAGQIARQSFRQPRVRVAAGIVLAMLFVRVTVDSLAESTYVTRSFFAVHRVVDDYYPGYRALIHGATVHGMQATAPRAALEPVTYFTKEGPIGQVFVANQQRLNSASIGVLGLGAGELAAYATAGQQWTFFEIDPAVEAIARERFSYLSRALTPIKVVIGDGRVSIARSATVFDVLIMDAFSSDAIPRHLVTTEALNSYLKRLAPDGLIAFNVSNRFVDLEPTLARLAHSLGLAGVIQFDTTPVTSAAVPSRLASVWVVLARSDADLGALARDGRWTRLRSDGGAPWTDEQADILTTIRWAQLLSLRVR